MALKCIQRPQTFFLNSCVFQLSEVQVLQSWICNTEKTDTTMELARLSIKLGASFYIESISILFELLHVLSIT